MFEQQTSSSYASRQFETSQRIRWPVHGKWTLNEVPSANPSGSSYIKSYLLSINKTDNVNTIYWGLLWSLIDYKVPYTMRIVIYLRIDHTVWHRGAYSTNQPPYSCSLRWISQWKMFWNIHTLSLSSPRLTYQPDKSSEIHFFLSFNFEEV